MPVLSTYPVDVAQPGSFYAGVNSLGQVKLFPFLSYTAHGILIGGPSGGPTTLALLTDGQLLVGQTGADPAPLTISGDITLNAAGAATVRNLPNGTTQAGAILATNVVPPGTPSAGTLRFYADSTAANLQMKNSSGTVATMVVPSNAVANQFLTGLDSAGVPLRAQPSFTNLSGTATVGQGGTGLTAGTSGGVLFYSAAGTLASSAALAANGVVIGGGAGAAPSTLGVGATRTLLQGTGGAPSWVAAPTVSGFTVNNNAAALPAPPSNTLVQIGNADASSTGICYDAWGTASVASAVQLRKARGTAAAPSAIQLDDPIGSLSAFGYGTNAYSTTQRAFLGFYAAENWTNTAQGTYAVIYTTPTGTVASAEALRIDSDKSAIFSGPALKPTTSAGATVGTATLPFSNTFLANGTKLDWANGNVTLTHSAAKLTLGGTLAVIGGAIDLSGSSAGQVIFPASQNASANANTLDDYEEGTWTPAFNYSTTPATSYASTTFTGTYTKIGRLVMLAGVATATVTLGSAAGSLQVTGLPFAAANIAGQNYYSALSWQGVTKAGYTNIVARIVSNTSVIDFAASGSGVSVSLVQAADTPTGGVLAFGFGVPYFTA